MPVISSIRSGILFVIVFILSVLITIPGCNTGSGIRYVSYRDPVLDSCVNEPGHRYYISMPVNLDAGKKIPLIIAIDPHGDGLLAVRNFTGALKGIPAVIAGSERLKNNYDGFEQSITSLVGEVSAKYPVDPDRIIVAGFSGGARMAYYYGMNHKVYGIIMYGAGPGRLPQDFGQRRLYAVSGTKDFNFMEQYSPLFSGMNDKPDYVTDFFRGTHEWPPSTNIFESVAYVLRDGQGTEESVLENMADVFLSEYDSLSGANDLFFAGKALEKAWHFVPGTKSKERVSAKIDVFKKMPGFIDYQQKFESYLHKEIKLKQAYAGRMNDPDTAWWHQEIISLHNNISSCPDSMQADYYYRIKGFVGIIFFSQINDLLKKGVFNEQVRKLLYIYEQAEPGSPDLFYFKALVQHRTGHEKEAQALLAAAIKRGFSDHERMIQDFGGS